MNTLEKTLIIVFAIVALVVAVYFARRQRIILRTLGFDENLSGENRRYLLKQSGLRFFGASLLVLLALLLFGSLFLDYDPVASARLNGNPTDAQKQAVRLLIMYWLMMLLILMVVLALAIFDLWATARFGVQQQKQLLQEHQNALESELTRLRQRRAELN